MLKKLKYIYLNLFIVQIDWSGSLPNFPKLDRHQGLFPEETIPRQDHKPFYIGMRMKRF